MSINPDVMAEFTIKVFKDGNVNISGPIQNKVLSLGVLELAKKAVIDFNPAKDGGGLIVPLGGIPGTS